MKRALAALGGALLAAACAFSSERPLFDARDGATPIEDGAQFYWREDGRSDDARRVVYRRLGAAYELTPVEDAEPEDRMEIVFVAVPETPEDDYIAQVKLFTDEDVRAYAFMWRTEAGFRIVASPGVVEGATGEAALARYCGARINSECRFDRAEDVVAFYREAIYPAFVTGGATPSNYIDQTLVTAEAPPK